MIAIAAMNHDRIIGHNGTIPWHLPADLKFFKRTTLGHVIVMGRKTFDSLGKPLPGRENWVVTSGPAIEGVRTWKSPESIIPPTDGRKLFVIGGAQLYTALLPRCSEIFLTIVNIPAKGDTWFPEFESSFDHGSIVESGENYQILHFRRSA